MEPYLIFVIVLLLTVLAFLAVIRFRSAGYEKEIRRLQKAAEDSYTRGRDEASELLRRTCDKIEEERGNLEICSDRELMIRIMLSMGSFGRRMDRIEEKLEVITHYKDYLEDMHTKVRSLSQSYILLEKDIAAVSAMIHRLQNAIGDTANGITNLLEEVADIATVRHTVSEYITQLSDISGKLEELHIRTASVTENMAQVMDTCDQSPMKKLKTIEIEITGLSLLLNTVMDRMEDAGRTDGQNGPVEYP